MARSTSYDYKEVASFIKQGLSHKGFSLVEIMTACPTYFGRLNELREPYDMLLYLRDTTEPLSEEGEKALMDAAKRHRTGIFRDEDRAEYVDTYQQMCREAAGATR